MSLESDLKTALQAAGVPVTNVYCPSADRATWQVGLSDQATSAHRATLAQVVASFVQPQTVFDPETLITTLFTPAEQIGFTSKPQGILFMGLVASMPAVDITAPTFRGYVAQAVQGGFLTQARADQVLAGTPV